jgi:hypothetical protein
LPPVFPMEVGQIYRQVDRYIYLAGNTEPSLDESYKEYSVYRREARAEPELVAMLSAADDSWLVIYTLKGPRAQPELGGKLQLLGESC